MQLVFSFLVWISLAFAQLPGDIPEDHWAGEAVAAMVELGIIVGFPDGDFYGADTLTRYQVALMLERLLTVIDQTVVSDIYDDIEGLVRQLNEIRDIAENAALLADESVDAQLVLSLVDEAFARIDALENRLIALEAQSPSTDLIFDTLRANLTQLEQAFTTNLLALQENILSELDMRMEVFDQSLRNAVEAVLEERIATLESQFETRFSGVEGDINRLDERLKNLNAEQAKKAKALELNFDEKMDDLTQELEIAAIPPWTVRTTAGGGFAGDGPRFTLAASAVTSDTTSHLVWDQEEFSVDATYALGSFLVGSLFETNKRGSVGGVTFGTNHLSPILMVVEAAYGRTPEVGVQLVHDGAQPNAVIRGLDIMTNARLEIRDDANLRTLIDTQAILNLSLGEVTLSPGFAYQRIDQAYQGFLGQLGLSYRFNDADIFAVGRYGLFRPMQDGAPRNAPEFTIGATYQAFKVEAFLDAGLPEFGRATFISAGPLERGGLNFGVMTSISLELKGSR